jgi:hypothetical protein
VIAKVIGHGRPLPSLEVASEKIVQTAAGGGGRTNPANAVEIRSVLENGASKK